MNTLEWPALNACLNATSALFISSGWFFARRHRVTAHKACMVAALVASTVFLVSYLAYHAQIGSKHFPGQGWVRPVYFAILLTHTVLAVVIVPLVLRSAWLGARGRIDAHRRLARVTAPLWLYVSVTGVVVYWMLYRVSW